MNKKKLTKEEQENDLYWFCVLNTVAYYKGELSKDKIKKLKEVDPNFFKHYEEDAKSLINSLKEIQNNE